jgi:hypothetical protein
MAVAMVSLLAMAALAIDVVTLYVARGEAQRAAESAALAGARMFVSSGYTSNPTGITFGDVCQSSPTSSAAANRAAVAVAQQNKIAGQAATIQTVACNPSPTTNPRMTITVQRTGLPTFFGRIFPSQVSTVSATATAEAYNASGQSGQIQLTGVKPFFVGDCLAGPFIPPLTCTTHHFLDPSGNPIPSAIGETLHFSRLSIFSPLTPTTNTATYYPLNIPDDPAAPICGSTSDASGSCSWIGSGGAGIGQYHDNIACTSQYRFSCGGQIRLPGLVNLALLPDIDPTLENRWTRRGVRCRIHASIPGTLGNDQDIITAGVGQPISIEGGDNNPNPDLRGANNISRSDSLITVPIYPPGANGTLLCPPGLPCDTANISGFLQLAVTQTSQGSDPTAYPWQFEAVVVNAVGCQAAGMSGTPVIGSGSSPIPVRLVQNTP